MSICSHFCIDVLAVHRILLVFFMGLFFVFPKTSFSTSDVDLSIYKKVTEENIKKIYKDRKGNNGYEVFIMDNTLSVKDIMRQHHARHNPQGQFSRNFRNIDLLAEMRFLYSNDCGSDEVDLASGERRYFDCYLKNINSNLDVISSISIDVSGFNGINYKDVVSQDFFISYLMSLKEKKQNIVIEIIKYSRPIRVNESFFVYSENISICDNLIEGQYCVNGADGVGFVLSKDKNNEFVVDESRVLWSTGLETTFGKVIVNKLNDSK
jgi:hypothetical protein